MGHFGDISSEILSCDICYDDAFTETDDTLIILKCCNNSKKICIKCINCLKTPICPYCRKSLDSSCDPFLNKQTLLASSAPTTNNNASFLSWDNFLSQENVIDPSLYDDSRRMRRMMRRLRYQYRQINSNASLLEQRLPREQRRNYIRRVREYNRNIAREAMNLHNQTSSYMDDIFFME